MKRTSFLMTEKYVFPLFSLNWIYLSYMTKVGDEKRSPSWVMAADVVDMISRQMDQQWINPGRAGGRILPLWCSFATSSLTKNATSLKLCDECFYLFYMLYPHFGYIACSTVTSSRFCRDTS